MINHANDLLSGAIFAMSITATTLFLRFWRHTRDPLFAFFAASFAIDGTLRIASRLIPGWGEDVPQIYLVRLFAYGLIVVAIVQKNRPRAK